MRVICSNQCEANLEDLNCLFFTYIIVSNIVLVALACIVDIKVQSDTAL